MGTTEKSAAAAPGCSEGENADHAAQAAAVAEAAAKPADHPVAPTGVPADGETPADPDKEVPTVKVLSQESIDYILSWEEKDPFRNCFEDDAEDREIFDLLAKSRDDPIAFQRKVREEFEATGYFEVDDDYEERVARLQAFRDAGFNRV